MSDNTENLEDLRLLIGDEKYEAVICRFGGQKLYIPCGGYVLPRNQQIKQAYDHLLNQGIPAAQALSHLSRKHKLSASWIRKILRNYPHLPK